MNRHKHTAAMGKVPIGNHFSKTCDTQQTFLHGTAGNQRQLFSIVWLKCLIFSIHSCSRLDTTWQRNTQRQTALRSSTLLSARSRDPPKPTPPGWNPPHPPPPDQ